MDPSDNNTGSSDDPCRPNKIDTSEQILAELLLREERREGREKRIEEMLKALVRHHGLHVRSNETSYDLPL